MGQIKHKMGNVGGGVDISHKSKMSGKAKSLMSFPGGMPGPGNYGSSDNNVVGKGMGKYLAGESVGMRKMDPMYNGEPGVQQNDFEQFGGPKKVGDKIKKENAGFNFSPPDKKKDKKDLIAGKGKQKDSYGKDHASKIYDVDQDGDSVLNDYNQDGTMLGRALKKAKSYVSGGAKKSSGPMDPGDPKKGAVVTGSKDKVSKKTTGMTAAEKKAELLYRKNLKIAINKAKRDERINEHSNLKEVRKDKKENKKVQRKRKSEGKDYVKYKPGTSKDGGAEESVVVRKKLKE